MKRKYHDHLFVLGVCLLLMVITEYVVLRKIMWDREAILLHSEWWRVMTGHFTHINEQHLLANLMGFAFAFYVLRLTKTEVAICTVTLSISISTVLFFTNADHYVGFSGVIHGLFTYAAMQLSLNGKSLGPALLYLVLGKLTYELYIDITEPPSVLFDLNASAASHVIGAFFGVVLGSTSSDKPEPTDNTTTLDDSSPETKQ